MFQFRIEENMVSPIRILPWLIHQLKFMYLISDKMIILYCLSESHELD